jgi:hypothetical protein
LATDLLKSGATVSCVWTGKKLGEQNLDITIAFPGPPGPAMIFGI